MRSLDPARLAVALAIQHGVEGGITLAALEAERSAEDGDQPGERMWRAVLRLLSIMQRAEPHRGERLH